jgi:hypothetical protein
MSSSVIPFLKVTQNLFLLGLVDGLLPLAINTGLQRHLGLRFLDLLALIRQTRLAEAAVALWTDAWPLKEPILIGTPCTLISHDDPSEV